MDKLGNRIKSDFEDRTRFKLPRRSYHILRLDGKAFHTYTKGCKRPFDEKLMSDMDETAKYLCSQIQGAKFAYTQSDEITIVFTDFDQVETDLWFDGNIQKIASVSASMATAYFNKLRPEYPAIALFDSRVFSVAIRPEVFNVFLWRQIDAMKNSVQMVARTFLGHKKCEGQHTEALKQLLKEAGHAWEDCPEGFKTGRMIFKESFTVEASTKETPKGTISIPAHERTRWTSQPAVKFMEDRSILETKIPLICE